MKRKIIWTMVSCLLTLSLVLSSCAAPEPEVVEKIVEEIREVPGKAYVTDPSTGKVVTAPEYGGTLTIAKGMEREIADVWFVGSRSTGFVSGVLEKLAHGDWAVDRDEWGWRSINVPPE